MQFANATEFFIEINSLVQLNEANLMFDVRIYCDFIIISKWYRVLLP